MTGWLGADRRGVLVPQFSTDDISPSPPLCIGCSDGWSTTHTARIKESEPRSTAAPPAEAAAADPCFHR
jgi:hypothetical protein